MKVVNPIISPASSLMYNGVAVFQDLKQLDGFKTPYKLKLNLMVVCVSGAISAAIDLDMLRMTAGQIMFLRPGHVVDDVTTAEDFSGYFLLVDESKYAATIPLTNGYMASCLAFFNDHSIITVDTAEMESVKMIYALLKQQMFKVGKPYGQSIFNNLCELLFFETLSLYSSVMDKKTVRRTRREELLGRFIALVEKDFKVKRSVNYYAEKLCLSPKHLSTVIKQSSGLTAGEWIEGKVIREAKYMLRMSPKTIQQIASELNFANQSFFGKYFKNLTGMTPRQYRLNPDKELDIL